jgi:hypothetical protein
MIESNSYKLMESSYQQKLLMATMGTAQSYYEINDRELKYIK